MISPKTFPVSPQVTPPPGGGPPGGGGGGCPSAPGCNCVHDFGHFGKGSQPQTSTFTFTNQLKTPLTFTGVKLTSAAPERWSYDASALKGTIQPGQTIDFSVTFHPPS